MYPQVFSAAQQVDKAFLIIFGFAVLVLLAVTVAMVWFLWRYHYKRNPVATDIKGSVLLEVVWTVLPLVIVMGLFWTGWTSFQAMRSIPENAMVVGVEGRMWSWKFTYENGKTSSELVVPVNRPIRLELTSRDVIHSLYIPAMRVKWDLVPGMDTEAWFQSDREGEFDIFCAEYCGLKHANMITLLKVVTQEEFDGWLEGTPDEPGGKPRGLALMEEYGCFDCHAMDGTADVAPPLDGIGGTDRPVVLPDGTARTFKANAAYLKTSILNPGAAMVEGWGDEMPPYEGDLSEEDADAIVNYLLGLDESGNPLAAPPHPGETLADEQGCFGCHTATGEDDVGPTFLGLFGTRRTVTDADGNNPRTVAVDEDYLRRAIIAPSDTIPEGFEDAMPAYDDLAPETLEGLIRYIESLGSGGDQ
ncbi:cytochrome c oxidase subunit II [Pseudodesulfovibrio portus]|uniref:Cytochrome c oxidase subunit 2 n=1 Tax=Pseudodesulfovibrio portus TaxID=231439 RepID=A0ABM8AU00_9BACT|nr:cytochrome c oxidase subunit II [Pseudodesulfovibrio portus]BDQ34976.1 cytochrome c oxidase subunit 2 [Pseudodesulfovibrio portus]